jgi:hypothetical protein
MRVSEASLSMLYATYTVSFIDILTVDLYSMWAFFFSFSVSLRRNLAVTRKPSVCVLGFAGRNWDESRNVRLYMESIRAGYGLDDRGLLPGRHRDFLHSTVSGSDQDSCPLGVSTRDAFSGDKAAGAWSWSPSPANVELRKHRVNASSFPYVFMAWCWNKQRDAVFIFLLWFCVLIVHIIIRGGDIRAPVGFCLRSCSYTHEHNRHYSSKAICIQLCRCLATV